MGKSVVLDADVSPWGIVLSADGTKLFVTGDNSNRVFRYSLSTAWDVSTATEDVSNYTLVLAAGVLRGIHIKADGTKLYVVNVTNDYVVQMTLSTAWDLTSATVDGTYTVASQEATPLGVSLSPDGTKLYVIGSGADAITEYDVTTAHDITGTVTYNSNQGDVSTQLPAPRDMFLEDGTNDYVFACDSTTINRYSMGTSFDVSTMSFDTGQEFAFTEGDTVDMTSIFFKPDGTELYAFNIHDDTAYQYTLATAWDVTTADYDPPLSEPIVGRELDVSAKVDPLRTVFVGDDGRKLFVADFTNASLTRYTLSTAWDVTTGTFDTGQELDLNTGGFRSIYDIWFSSDGTKFYYAQYKTGDVNIRQFTLSTAWDVTSGTYDGNYDHLSELASARGIALNSDGTKMYLLEDSTVDTVYEYDLTTAWDITGTVTYNSNSLVVTQAGIGGTVAGMSINKADDHLFIIYGFDTVARYTMSTAGDITSGTLDSGQEFPLPEQLNGVTGLVFRVDGTEMYTSSNDNPDRVVQYQLSTPWDLTTAFFKAPTAADGSVTLSQTVSATADSHHQYADATVTLAPAIAGTARVQIHADATVTLAPTVVVTAENNTNHAAASVTLAQTVSGTLQGTLHADATVVVTPTIAAAGRIPNTANANLTFAQTVAAQATNTYFRASLALPVVVVDGVMTQTEPTRNTIPSFTMAAQAVAGGALVHAPLRMQLPAFEVRALGGNELSVILPSLTATATAISSSVSIGSMVLPSLIATSGVGDDRFLDDNGTLSLPSLTLSGSIVAGTSSDVSVSIPLLYTFGVNAPGTVSTGASDLPTFTMEDLLSAMISANIITADLTLPSLQTTGFVQITATLTHSGWVFNTESMRTSEYDNYNYLLVTKAFGKYMGVSTDGIYELTGDTDNTADINADVLFGFDSFRTEDLKRVKAVHVGYRADAAGDLNVQIVVDGEDKIREYSVKHVSSTSGIKRGRATIAKGLKSRYWQYGLKNVAGADFTIDDLSVYVQQHNRKAQ